MVLAISNPLMVTFNADLATPNDGDVCIILSEALHDTLRSIAQHPPQNERGLPNCIIADAVVGLSRAGQGMVGWVSACVCVGWGWGGRGGGGAGRRSDYAGSEEEVRVDSVRVDLVTVDSMRVCSSDV